MEYATLIFDVSELGSQWADTKLEELTLDCVRGNLQAAAAVIVITDTTREKFRVFKSPNDDFGTYQSVMLDKKIEELKILVEQARRDAKDHMSLEDLTLQFHIVYHNAANTKREVKLFPSEIKFKNFSPAVKKAIREWLTESVQLEYPEITTVLFPVGDKE